MSGVVVTADGWVVSCAHHFIMPGETVTVAFADGRTAAAVVTGTHLASNVSLLKMTAEGPWPYAEMGSSLSLAPGDACLVTGYPAHLREKQPLVRTTKLAGATGGGWSRMLSTLPACELYAGDAGGGVFDADARLVAVRGDQVRTADTKFRWARLIPWVALAVHLAWAAPAVGAGPGERDAAVFERRKYARCWSRSVLSVTAGRRSGAASV